MSRDKSASIDPAHLERILHDCAIGLAIVSVRGDFVEVNPALCQMFARDAQDLLSCTWQELTHPDDLAADESLVAEVLSGSRDSYRLRKRYLRPDGEVIWGDLSVAASRDEVGDVEFFIAQILDVTRTVEIQKQATDSEFRYRALAENISEVVSISSAEAGIEWMSPSVTALLGWQPHELVGRDFVSLVHPDDLESVVSTQHSIAKGAAGGFEARMMTASGQWRWVLVSVNQAVGPDGSARRFGIIRDYQERWEARQLLAEREEHYRLLAEHSSDVILRVSLDGIIEWASPSAHGLLGIPADELVGMRNSDFVHPDHREEFLATGRALAASGADSRLIVPALRRDGTTLIVEAVGQLIPARLGRPAARVVRIRDVDREQRILRELTEARALLEAVRDSLMDPQLALRAKRDECGSIVDFTVLEANRAAIEFLGDAAANLCGQGISETLGSIPSVDSMLKLLAQALKIRTSVQREAVPMYSLMRQEIRRFDFRVVPFGNDRVSVVWRDVTREFDAAQMLADSERHYRLLAENVSDVVLVVNMSGAIDWASPSLSQNLDWQPEDWRHRPIQDFVHPDDRHLIVQNAHDIAAGGAIFRMRLRDRDGNYHWMEVSAAQFIDAQRGPFVAATLRIADGQVAREQELDQRARFDSLSGLPNRPEAHRRMAQMAESPALPAEGAFVAFVDLDNLKCVNDRHGHAAGDALIREVGQRLGSEVRDSDLVARFGGDEFVVVLFGLKADEALRRIRALTDSVCAPISWGTQTLTPGVSVGLAEMTPERGFEQTVMLADGAMYRAKAKGGNRVEVVA